jgi:hypothetical protein
MGNQSSQRFFDRRLPRKTLRNRAGFAILGEDMGRLENEDQNRTKTEDDLDYTHIYGNDICKFRHSGGILFRGK